MDTNHNMNNLEIAKLLNSVAAALEVKGANSFRINAYKQAANSILQTTTELKDFWEEKKLTTLPGIGPNIANHLDELFRTGRVRHFIKIIKGLPEAMFVLIEIPDIGPKTSLKLCKRLGITRQRSAIKRLEKAVLDGEIRRIEGFGEDSERNILEGIKELKSRSKRMALPFAQELANKIIDYLKTCPYVDQACPLGSLRRKTSTVGDIDLAVATDSPQKVIKHFINFKDRKKVIEEGQKKATILLKNNQQIDLRVQDKASFGSLLQHFTGSKNHNIHLREIVQKKGLSLSEYGLRKGKNKQLINFKDEESLYSYLGLAWIPPELRENQGEIEAAQNRTLPDLINLQDIKGDLHVHTNFDIETSHDIGFDSGLALARKAAEKKYEYLGFADHNPSTSKHNFEQIISIIKRRNQYIEQIKRYCENNRETILKKMFIFNGLEVDIRQDGSLAIPDEALSLLDYVIASVHSSFRMAREEITERILKALDHPKVKILGHPSGRELGRRPALNLDWEKIFAKCKENSIYLEINAWPKRLDLPDFLVREAIKHQVILVINSDSHATSDLDLMEFGVDVARRGWAEKKNLINALSLEKLNAILTTKGGDKE